MPTKVTQVEMTAVIPTTQYGNIQPKFTLEGGTVEKMKEKGLELIQEVWDEYGEKPLKKKTDAPVDGIEFEQKLSFTGENILWSEYLHEYRSLDGTRLISGSEYNSLTEKPFNSALLSEKSGNAWGVNKDELADLWKINGKIATDYGTAVHTALEAYMRFHQLGAIVQEKKGLEHNYALPKNEYLRDTVLSFVNMFGTFDLAEVFVTDTKNRMAGQIDGVNILDMQAKVCSLGDYKTNFEMKKSKLKGYTKQLNFYRTALENKGWTVESMNVYHLNGSKWNHHVIDREEIDMKLLASV
jgi:hypothetical protein